MRVRVGCEFRHQTQAPVPMLMLVRARPDAEHQSLYESTWTEPNIPLREYRDSFENPCWRLLLPDGARYRYRSGDLRPAASPAGEPAILRRPASIAPAVVFHDPIDEEIDVPRQAAVRLQFSF